MSILSSTMKTALHSMVSPTRAYEQYAEPVLLKAENAALRRQNEGLQDKLVALRETIQGVREQNEVLLAGIAALEKKGAQAEEALAQAEEALAQTRVALDQEKKRANWYEIDYRKGDKPYVIGAQYCDAGRHFTKVFSFAEYPEAIEFARFLNGHTPGLEHVERCERCERIAEQAQNSAASAVALEPAVTIEEDAPEPVAS